MTTTDATFDPSTWKPTHTVACDGGPVPLMLLHTFQDYGRLMGACVAGNGYVSVHQMTKLTPLPLTAADIGLPETWYAAVTDWRDDLKERTVYLSEGQARFEWPARRIAVLQVVEVLP